MREPSGQPPPNPLFDATALERHRSLVARIARGESEALQLLYLELSPIVNGIVRRMLEDPEDARETVQDTFIRVWKNAAAFNAERGEVVAWAVFIARHAAIDRLRRGARQRLLYETLQREADVAPAAPPPATPSDTREEVTRRLNALPPNQRQALELAFFGGCSQAQIAATMRMPIGNVKNHLRRGLQKLRQLARRDE